MMKNQTMKTSILGWVAFTAIAGCSVENRTVLNEPPQIPTNVASSDARPQFGVLTPKSITIFYWPEGQTEEQRRVASRKVTAASIKIDTIAFRAMEYQRAVPGLEYKFTELNCIEDWADPDHVYRGQRVDRVEKWKTLDPVAEVPPVGAMDPRYPDYVKYREYLGKKQVLDACIANQTQRESMMSWLQAAPAEQQAAEIEVAATIDKDPTRPVNMKTVSAVGSSIVLQPEGNGPTAVVTLKDFMVPGYSPSTDAADGQPKVYQASYIASRKLLTFGIPEIVLDVSSGSVNPSGAIIECALERGPDLSGMARFSGEIKLKDKTGKVLRDGRISITGELKPN